MSVTKIWIILRKVLRWKAYTPHVSACLSQANTEAHRKSAEWFLAHDSLFFEEKVIWTSIADLKAVVEDFVESIDPAIIRKSCASARKRFEMMMLENGGRFEHKMTALKPLIDGDH